MIEFFVGFIAIFGFILLVIQIAHFGKCSLNDALGLAIVIPIAVLAIIGGCMSLGETILSVLK